MVRDIVNYLVTNEVPSHWSAQISESFSLELRIITGMTLIFLSIVPTRSFDDVYPIKSSIAFYPFHTITLVVDTLEQEKRMLKYYSAVFIGLLFFKIHTNFIINVHNVNK